MGLPWVTHSEPINALSIPTWAIHFSSVIEYLIAMSLVWKYAEVTGNEKWKGLTWGMLPLHASGICACTYHFFYNPSSLQFLVSMQAGLTLLGNLTCAIAAFRIARSNGWNLDEVNPFPKSSTAPTGLVADGIAAMPLTLREAEETNQVLVAKVIGLTVFLSYLIKYGELGLDLPFEPNAPVALGMVLGIPAITAFQYYQKSEPSEEGEGGGFSFNLGDNSLSMDDVKKYGKAGTLAYVLTELAFWVVAFPVASTALYQSTGHWPDVINETGDRAAVLGFIFAGANIARAFVPVRLGAALALAPWVDENLLGGDKDDDVVAS
jgi:amino acid transporter